LVDNGSTDGSVEYVQMHFPEVTIVALPRNLGFCAANNLAIKQAQGDYIALLNNDTEVTSQWLGELKKALDTYGEAGFCASKMLFYNQRDTIDTAGDLFYSCGVGGKRGHGAKDGERFSRKEYLFGACAGAAIYRRSMLEEIGLFDEDLSPAYDEDIDLSFRAQLAGYRCLFVPEAVVYHHVASTFRSRPGRALFLARRNSFDVLIKNMPVDLLLKNFAYIGFYYLAGDLFHMMRGRWREVLKARWANLRNLRKMLGKRKRVQQSKKVSSGYIASLLTPGRVRDILRALLGGR